MSTENFNPEEMTYSAIKNLELEIAVNKKKEAELNQMIEKSIIF
jgi:hypothetical protein